MGLGKKEEKDYKAITIGRLAWRQPAYNENVTVHLYNPSTKYWLYSIKDVRITETVTHIQIDISLSLMQFTVSC